MYSSAPVTRKELPGPTSIAVLFEKLDVRCKQLLDQGKKVVYKNALTRLPDTVRQSDLGVAIMAFNVGSYLYKPESLHELFKITKEHDDAHRALLGQPALSYDEAWDEVGPFLLTFVKGFTRKYHLTPHISPGTSTCAGAFRNLL